MSISTQELIDRGFSTNRGATDMLLVFPPMTVAERYGKKTTGDSGGDLPPLGIMYIAGYLRQHGYGVGFLDGCALNTSIDKIVSVIKEREPKSVGISATTFSFNKAIDLAQQIKKHCPNTLVILGGAHATAVPLHPMENYDCFDLLVYGEGEVTSLEILDTLKKHNYNNQSLLNDVESLKAIDGLVYRFNGKVFKTGARSMIEDLDKLPLPARDLIPHERYIPLPNQYRQLPLAHMMVIRGCPFTCTFCDEAGTKVRASSPEHVVEEIKEMSRLYGIKEISFWDDTMTYHRKWMMEFCQRMIAAKLEIVWSCFAAANTVDPEILDMMKKAGCWNIFYGFESPDLDLLKNIDAARKNKNPDYMKQVVKWTQEAGIEVRASFLIAIPGETPEKAKEMIRFAKEMAPNYAQFSITTPLPGTILYDEIKQGKWGRLTTEDYSQYHMWNVVFLPKGYKNKEEVFEMEKYAFRSFYLRPKYIIKKTLSIRSIEDIRRHWKGLQFLLGFLEFPLFRKLLKLFSEQAPKTRNPVVSAK